MGMSIRAMRLNKGRCDVFFTMVVDYVLRNSVDTIKSKGFKLHPRRSSRHQAEYLTDTDFADDIALISNSLENAQAPLHALEEASNCVCLNLNESKTEYMSNCKTNPIKTPEEALVIKPSILQTQTLLMT